MRIRRAFVMIGAAALAFSVVGPVRAQAACSTADAPWPQYAGPGMGGRHQTDTTVTAENAGTLERRWFINTSVIGGGEINNTPIVARGCIVVATSNGSIAAINENGAVLWSYRASVTGGSGLGGTIVGSPAVVDDKVIVAVGQKTTPYVVALNLATGALVWQRTVDNHPGNFLSASPVIAGDLLFVGISGDEYGATARGGYVLLDVADGSIKAFRRTIGDAEYAAGYRGASIWASGSYHDGFVYVGSGNPASKTKEHRYSNSLLKIDVRPWSPTFAEIVGAYKGNVDQYYPGLERQPACDTLGDRQPNLPQYPWSLFCVQFDIDFGASPNLWHDQFGNLVVGSLQKSGVFHSVYADNMQLAWSTVVPGAPCFVCNASSSATDGDGVYVAGSPGSVLTALSANAGRYRWALPLADGIHFQSVSVAKGVVYTVTSHGLFMAVDARSGVPLSVKSFRRETGASGSALSSSGISIAGNTVYAPSGQVLMALSPTA